MYNNCFKESDQKKIIKKHKPLKTQSLPAQAPFGTVPLPIGLGLTPSFF